jgi:hypothetical protein
MDRTEKKTEGKEEIAQLPLLVSARRASKKVISAG